MEGYTKNEFSLLEDSNIINNNSNNNLELEKNNKIDETMKKSQCVNSNISKNILENSNEKKCLPQNKENINKENILNIMNSDEFYKVDRKKNINDTIVKEVVYDTFFINNNFIKDLKNNFIIKSNKYPNLDNIIRIYYKNYSKIINGLNNHKYFIFLLNIIYLLLIIFILFGFMLPHKLLIFHIFISIIFLILFENKNNKDPINIILNYFYKKNINLIPISSNLIKNITLFITLISFIGLINKNYSFFSFLILLGNNLLKYH